MKLVIFFYALSLNTALALDFETQVINTGFTHPYVIKSADFNQDGKLDFLVSDFISSIAEFSIINLLFSIEFM